jgi:membrane associated rhomboid family serine protease
MRRIGVAIPHALSVTTLLALALVAVHVRVLVAAGGGIASTPVGLLIAFGGHWPPAISEEPWRLVTAMFLHAGLWHLAFNLLAIAMVGPRVETTYGRPAMLFLFVVTGTLANVGSGAVGLAGVGIGASGGVMGLIGAMAGYGHRDGTWAGRTLRNDMLKWSAYTFIFGYFVGADNWAHLFGGVVGAAFGYAIRPARWTAPSLLPVRAVAGLVGVAAAIGALVIIFTRVPTQEAVSGYELSYEPYAKICRRHFDGDPTGARDELAALAAKHETLDLPPDIQVTSLCESMLLVRDACRTGNGPPSTEICERVERAFGHFKEVPRELP